MAETTEITLRRPDDWHLHLRDGDMLKAVLAFTARRFARAIVMPNLSPPVRIAAEADAYRGRIIAALAKDGPKGVDFTPLMTCYLTDDADGDDIVAGHRAGVFTAVKLYPAGATTNSADGVTDMARVEGVLGRMEEADIPLLVHGEVTDPGVDVFDREAVFIERILAPMIERFPGLKVVFEHITTSDAADFVASGGDTLAATVTAHHLMINRGAMFDGGIRPHLYCLPVAKRETHRLALRRGRPSSSSAPIPRPMRLPPRRPPAAAPESSRPRRRWRCMPRCSTKKARWINSRPSLRSTARPFTGWRSTRKR